MALRRGVRRVGSRLAQRCFRVSKEPLRLDRGRGNRLRIHFLLPSLHRVRRGAEIAFESIATELAKLGLDEITLVGSGEPIAGRPYKFQHSGLIPRERFERFPKGPVFRSEYIWEEATWALNYMPRY